MCIVDSDCRPTSTIVRFLEGISRISNLAGGRGNFRRVQVIPGGANDFSCGQGPLPHRRKRSGQCLEIIRRHPPTGWWSVSSFSLGLLSGGADVFGSFRFSIWFGAQEVAVEHPRGGVKCCVQKSPGQNNFWLVVCFDTPQQHVWRLFKTL